MIIVDDLPTDYVLARGDYVLSRVAARDQTVFTAQYDQTPRCHACQGDTDAV